MEEKNEEQIEQPSSEEMIAKANDTSKRLEDANIRLEKSLARQENLKAQEALNGKAEAKNEQKEETPQEYKNRVMAGEQ